MDKDIFQEMYHCIDYLSKHGFGVYKKGNKQGKWVAFRQEGMSPILHGKVVDDCQSYYKVRCKNGEKRFPGLEDIIGFYDSKQDCYSVR